MKTKEELNVLKAEIESVNEKLHELTPEELEQVTGGLAKTSYETLKIELWDYEGLKDMPPCE